MSDERNGLRFDVYERVHLPDGVAAIDELEEIELVPQIQVIEQGEHAILKGQLLLSGVYRSKSEQLGMQTLEHWIPVEISLPMNRVSRLEDISVEIDNFDVDLLSSRTLNVTGVLSLKGILMEPLPEAAEPWKEAPFTAVHRREQDETPSYQQPGAYPYYPYPQAEMNPQPEFYPQGAAYPQFQQPEAAVEPYAQPEEYEYAASERDVQPENGQAEDGYSSYPWIAAEPAPAERAPEAQQFEPEPAEYEAEPEATYETFEAIDYNDAYEAGAADEAEQPAILQGREEPGLEPEPVAEPELEAVSQPDPEPEPEPEKQEMRIAFGAKQDASPDQGTPNVGLLTLLQTSRREQAARQAAEETAAKQNEQKRNDAYVEEIEWSNLFLGKQAGSTEFRKIRMCIVQKEETLESIAFRYSMNPREILLHNRLSDSSVTEGQLLYIPQ